MIVTDPSVKKSANMCGESSNIGKKFREMKINNKPVRKMLRNLYNLLGDAASCAAPETRLPADDNAPLAAPAAAVAPPAAFWTISKFCNRSDSGEMAEDAFSATPERLCLVRSVHSDVCTRSTCWAKFCRTVKAVVDTRSKLLEAPVVHQPPGRSNQQTQPSLSPWKDPAELVHQPAPLVHALGLQLVWPTPNEGTPSLEVPIDASSQWGRQELYLWQRHCLSAVRKGSPTRPPVGTLLQVVSLDLPILVS
eukprot:CAMPEP_0194545658 /NCGR_PEP_ID=MMETSP0253-20130528/89530_1 /TAXON_ID=2966 /ORGANISM="Noctiluca scintillans" /LENGTH=250 /DNA_ID=CAMNT_0039392675 /DNA_START=367 /DNA_END=1121 /DNA_ORIENTATION=-